MLGLAFAGKQYLQRAGSAQIQSSSASLATDSLPELHISIHPFPVVVEEQIDVSISGLQNAEITSAWVEGVNMFMGKIPVVLEQQEDGAKGWFFLGSCSEPKMQWQLVLQLSLADSSSQRVTYVFATNAG